METSPTPETRHRLHENVQGLLAGTLFVALGAFVFGEARLVTGGTAGLALLVSYAFGWSFGPVFFCINLPFYVLAWLWMGPRFTLLTIASVGLVSLIAWLLPLGLTIAHISTPLAALLGGMLMGVGLLMLFRHRASLGGVNVIALHMQEHHGWSAGYVQLVLDLAILAISLAILDPWRVLLSVAGAAVLNLTLAINHKPGRYVAL